MAIYPNAPGNKFFNKDNQFKVQTKTVLASFTEHPKTMLEVSFETGILRANICRYIAQLQREGRIYLAFKHLCPITRHPAGFYTSDFTLVKMEPNK